MKNDLVFIALGSNLNNPVQQVTDALLSLKQLPHTILEKVSSYYLNDPMGPAAQPDFINCVAALNTHLSPEALLDHLQNIELKQGRIRTLKWGPRTIDLDILIYRDQVIKTPRLTIPHCGLTDRAFFILPFFEIAPQFILPDGETINDLKNKLPSTAGAIRRLFPGENLYAENSHISGQF